MTTQQQAFQVYYSSLTDAELMKIAANKRSFLDVAQAALANELRGRNLTLSEPAPSADTRTAQSHPDLPARMAGMVRGWFSSKR